MSLVHDASVGSPSTGDAPAVITGVAGFIGSHLADALLASGQPVLGVDRFDDYYGRELKEANLANATSHANFDLLEADIRTVAHTLFHGVDTVYHLAGRPGVQDSWTVEFERYCLDNIAATQAVFDAALASGVRRVVVASSSSVYGNGASATGERLVAPTSPYGVSKAATEQLASVYRARGLDVVCLRYFTVYGPRQRPDMAMARLFAATVPGGAPFRRRGSGDQRREFTYVGDVVKATIAAGTVAAAANHTFDIGGGSSVSLNEVIDHIGAITGRAVPCVDVGAAPGDPAVTEADCDPATEILEWKPVVAVDEGLARQGAALPLVLDMGADSSGPSSVSLLAG
ncbi:MAG: NAD-dependent epimerase/dehydratase family protein [Actinomycetota bacterium]